MPCENERSIPLWVIHDRQGDQFRTYRSRWSNRLRSHQLSTKCVIALKLYTVLLTNLGTFERMIGSIVVSTFLKETSGMYRAQTTCAQELVSVLFSAPVFMGQSSHFTRAARSCDSHFLRKINNKIIAGSSRFHVRSYLQNQDQTCKRKTYLNTTIKHANLDHTCKPRSYLQTKIIPANQDHACQLRSYMQTKIIPANQDHTRKPRSYP